MKDKFKVVGGAEEEQEKNWSKKIHVAFFCCREIRF